MHRLLSVVVMTSASLCAQDRFEVASIKPSKPGAQGKAIGIQGRQLMTAVTSVADLVTWAYGVSPTQIVGGPAWVESEKYNIVAKPEGNGRPTDKQWKAMLQGLLADRFHLALHRERKELDAYVILVEKNGPKLTRSKGDPNGHPGAFLRQPGVVDCNNAAIADLAFLLQTTALDRPVVDQTQLAGRWDLTLNWTPDESEFGGRGAQFEPPTDHGKLYPDLVTAMREQLGLRLATTKAFVQVLVIDRVARPTPN